MPTLVLEIRPGETFLINGAAIRFQTRARLELVNHARFLFGKQIMPPEQADSPARRIYFALQTAYTGAEEEREAGILEARRLIAEFQAAIPSSHAREILERALAAAEGDDCYTALKLARRIIGYEDVELGRKPAMPLRAPTAR